MRKENMKILKEYLLKNKNDDPVKIIADCLDKIKQEKVRIMFEKCMKILLFEIRKKVSQTGTGYGNLEL